MLLQTVKASNRRGSLLALPLGELTVGIFIKDIEGLGPVDASLVSSGFAGQDGEQPHSAKRGKRNIVMKLGLEPDYGVSSVQALRSYLYDFFMTKSWVDLTFRCFDRHTDVVLNQYLDLDISGQVETNNPQVFSKDPEMDISIICFEPDFVDPNQVIFEGETVSDMTETVLSYAGNIETGVVFKLFPDRAMEQFNIYLRQPNGAMQDVEFAYPLLAGDEVTISSVQGSKYASVKRAGVETRTLYAIPPQSSWLDIYPGDNTLRVHDGGAPVPYTIQYLAKYGAI